MPNFFDTQLPPHIRPHREHLAVIIICIISHNYTKLIPDNHIFNLIIVQPFVNLKRGVCTKKRAIHLRKLFFMR